MFGTEKDPSNLAANTRGEGTRKNAVSVPVITSISKITYGPSLAVVSHGGADSLSFALLCRGVCEMSDERFECALGLNLHDDRSVS